MNCVYFATHTLQSNPSRLSLVTQLDTRGRKPFLSAPEDQIIVQAIIKFARDVTPLLRDSRADFMAEHIKTFPVKRQNKSPFQTMHLVKTSYIRS